ncbi:hypothetical protein [Helicobacter fennelliae]|uniref:Uncharacterized protein n=1 Tax=Helicobacter fennelliae MRY12-0050 TaxID=1325130 RepID=T1CZN5_9HELI|nr:hypothetical protein [Helicobacter fennelliae]GAD18396.1 hypothetical protein HFN_2324 [Helicobacter fennelliae MRY12-0050]
MEVETKLILELYRQRVIKIYTKKLIQKIIGKNHKEFALDSRIRGLMRI